MRDIDLFQLALGLVPPWMVADAKFDADKKRLDIEIDFKTGGRCSCPKCGKADCPVHDTVKKSWRHLNFFQHEAFLHARVARIDCSDCGVLLVNVPWARPGSGFTLLFEAFVMALVKGMPVAAAARLVGEYAGFQRLRTAIPIDCGQSFQSIADSIPAIADRQLPSTGFMSSRVGSLCQVCDSGSVQFLSERARRGAP